MAAAEAGGPLRLGWDTRTLEIRTKSVEKTLEPLVIQVTTLVSQNGPSGNKKGRSKKAHVLCEAVCAALDRFIIEGEKVARENPEIQQDMLAAVADVKNTGDIMYSTSREFADDPCSAMKRGAMVRSARALLSAVTRLLILADMVDVYVLLSWLQLVKDDLERLRDSSNQQGVVDNFNALGRSVVELTDRAGRRQLDLKDDRRRDELAAARATLKRHSVMLLTSSKAYVRHPEVAAARDVRDYVLRQVGNAVNAIGGAAQASGPSQPHPYEAAGELAAALDEFDQRVLMEPHEYSAVRTRPSLEERLESIISGAALLADSSCTRDERREKIVRECNAVRQALQDLLTEYERNQQQRGTGSRDPEAEMQLGRAVETVCKKTRDLRKQLRKAVVDHVSDSFLETNVPLLVLIEAAHSGNESEVEEYAQLFAEHAYKLVEVAGLACSMSTNVEGIKMVRLAASQLEALCPQVINAARLLVVRPKSKVASDNMEAFKDAWERQVRILTEAVDDITTIDDFLAVSESHILEDINKCVGALREGDADTLDRTAGAIRGRCARVCNVVSAEMGNFNPCVYTEKVLETVAMMRDQVMTNFAVNVEAAVSALMSAPQQQQQQQRAGNAVVDENEFAYAAQLVYDGVREIRRVVLMNKSSTEDDSDVEPDYNTVDRGNARADAVGGEGLYQDDYYSSQYEHYNRQFDSYTDDPYDTLSCREQDNLIAHAYEEQEVVSRSGAPEYADQDDLIEGKPTRAWLRELPESEKMRIRQEIDVFREEKRKLDAEIAKWDSRGNDIILLAKQMCMIMMEMTDFTRGRGPLKTTTDVISAAKKISEFGTSLNGLCQQISDNCPDSTSKNDLVAYQHRIILCCHQLNITSKVKADVQNVGGELIVSALDSATSLIMAAKNLMNAVVLAVKASYVASTKYKKGMSMRAVVHWRMKPPEKKSLITSDTSVDKRVHHSAARQSVEPIKALSEFDSF